MAVLADYRSDVYNNLGAATDAGKWTPTMLDAALRLALKELDSQIIYEDDFEVSTTGYEQDLSAITAVNMVLGLCYPWVEGSEFGYSNVQWRVIGNNVVYVVGIEPQEGEIIRVRYSKLHAIDDLDSASATTVADQHRALLGLWAAAYACETRGRQSGELHLFQVAERFRLRALEILSHVPPRGRPVRWGSVGLE